MSLLPELLLTVLFGTQASFTHPGVILPQKESLGDSELKAIVKKSQRSREARCVFPCVKRDFTESIIYPKGDSTHSHWILTLVKRDLRLLITGMEGLDRNSTVWK